MIPLAERSRNLRILSLEEDAVTRKLLEACLDVIGAEAVFASSGPEAVWYFRHHPVDLVFMDLDQHASQGLAAYEGIRATPRRGHVPILAVTQNDCRWTEDEYRDAGFAGLFLKPIEPFRLYAAMDAMLREANQPPLLAEPGAPPRAVETHFA